MDSAAVEGGMLYNLTGADIALDDLEGLAANHDGPISADVLDAMRDRVAAVVRMIGAAETAWRSIEGWPDQPTLGPRLIRFRQSAAALHADLTEGAVPKLDVDAIAARVDGIEQHLDHLLPDLRRIERQVLARRDAREANLVRDAGIAVLGALCSMLTIMVLYRRQAVEAARTERRAMALAASAERDLGRLTAAIEGMADGVALWDADEHLIDWNPEFASQVGPARSVLEPGLRFDALVQAMGETWPPDLSDDPRPWTDVIRGWHRAASGNEVEWQLPDGRCIRARSRLTREGGWVTVWSDVTVRRAERTRLEESEARYRTLFAQSADGIVIWDVESAEIVEVNRSFAVRLGFRPDELAGQSINRIVAESPSAQRKKVIDRVRNKGQATVMSRHLRRDGSIMPVEVTVSLIVIDGRERVLSFVRDISQRTEAKRRLVESENRFRTMVEGQTMVGTYLLTRRDDGSVELAYGSPKLCSILGYSNEELLNFSLPDLVIPEERDRIARNIEQRFAGEELSEPYNIHMVHADGRVIVAEVHASLVSFSGDPAVLGMVRDVTGQLEAESRVRDADIARQAAENANRTKSAFLANMSHELRTPLTSILGFAETVAEETADTEHARMAYRIVENAERLAELINDVLDLAKIEANKLTFNFERTDLGSLVRAVVDQSQAMARKRDLAVVIDDKVPAALRVHCDPARMHRVIENLLSNAYKFALAGSTVRVTLRRQHRAIRFSIANQGEPIPPGEFETIFHPFTQSSATDAAGGGGGTGLGLALCREMVEAHDGQIWAEHSQEFGTVFNVVLPTERTPGIVITEDHQQ